MGAAAALSAALSAALWAALCSVVALTVAWLRLSLRVRSTRRVLGVLHPYSHDGGGGERVLWASLAALSSSPRLHEWRIVLYTGEGRDTSSHDTMLALRAAVRRRFGLELPQKLEIVTLRTRSAIEPQWYPLGTLLGQALGSLLLTAEAVWRAPPELLFDTTGYGFSYAWLKLLGVRKVRAPRFRRHASHARTDPAAPRSTQVACYVHYPIVTSEMCSRVASRAVAHNNASAIARSPLLTRLKLLYYRLLIRAYWFSGRRADVVLANGSWTANHLSILWDRSVPTPTADATERRPSNREPIVATSLRSRRSTRLPNDVGVASSAVFRIIFPPCDTVALEKIPLSPRPSSPLIVLSIGQFRPEKDHQLQLRAFARVLHDPLAGSSDSARPVLMMAGAVRHSADAARLHALVDLAHELGLRTNVVERDAFDPFLDSLAQQPVECTKTSTRDGTLAADVVFAPNLDRGQLHRLFGMAAIGLHTMWNEHFGIGVVELMAAGIPPVAHASGGPLLDIVVPRGEVGLLAASEEEYAASMVSLLFEHDADERRRRMGERARRSVSGRFSERAFSESLCEAMSGVLEG